MMLVNALLKVVRPHLTERESKVVEVLCLKYEEYAKQNRALEAHALETGVILVLRELMQPTVEIDEPETGPAPLGNN